MRYVLIPGILCDQRVWAEQIALLESCGITADNIIVADLTRDNTLNKMAKRLLAQFDGPMNIIAFSLGTQVAFEIMKIAPQRVTKLLLNATVCGKLTPQLIESFRHAAQRMAEDFNGYLNSVFSNYLANGGTNYQTTRETFMAMAKTLGVEVGLRQLNALLTSTISQQDAINIHCPTLIVAGALDRRTTAAEQKILQKMMPNAEIEIIADVEHFATLQAPQAFNAILKSWLTCDKSNLLST